MKPIKLEPEQIWQKVETLDVRTIFWVNKKFVSYYVWGGVKEQIWRKNFIDWIHRNPRKVKLIGTCDIETGKARAVK